MYKLVDNYWEQYYVATFNFVLCFVRKKYTLHSYGKQSRQIIIDQFQQWTARIKFKSDSESEKLAPKDIKKQILCL